MDFIKKNCNHPGPVSFSDNNCASSVKTSQVHDIHCSHGNKTISGGNPTVSVPLLSDSVILASQPINATANSPALDTASNQEPVHKKSCTTENSKNVNSATDDFKWTTELTQLLITERS